MNDNDAAISKATADFHLRIIEASAALRRARTPLEFAACERGVHELSRAVADEITTIALQAICADPERIREAAAEVRATAAGRGVKMLSEGRSTTPVRLLGGTTVSVRASYLRSKPWSEDPLTQRGKDGTGVYPVLDQLGISGRATPALRLRVAHAVCEANSVSDARELMAQGGLKLDHKAALRLTYAVTEVALSARRTAIRTTKEGDADGEYVGRRVVACVDGGRTRIRKALRGRPRKGGRRHFQTDWREPKVICVYVLDDNGEMDATTKRVIDGTLADADATFDLLLFHLRALGAHQAEQLVLMGDGAKWIWRRTKDLRERLGIDEARVVEVVDHYHALERLHEFARARNWTKSQTKRWFDQQKRRLKRGRIDRVIAGMVPHLTAEETESGTAIEYWSRNEERLQFGLLRKKKLPIGSGAVESAVRRVINMRLKGPSICWREDHAEGLIHLRSASKSGRWDELEARVLANSRWRPSSRRPAS